MSIEFKTVLTETPLRVKVAKVVGAILLCGMVFSCFKEDRPSPEMAKYIESQRRILGTYSRRDAYPENLEVTLVLEGVVYAIVEDARKKCGLLLKAVAIEKDLFDVECANNDPAGRLIKINYTINSKTGNVI